MARTVLQSLQKLERQFAEIKTLIPEVNLWIAQTLRLETYATNRFRHYASSWEKFKPGSEGGVQLIEWSPEAQQFVAQKTLVMMQTLVLTRRQARAAGDRQIRHKRELFTLLKSLHQQAMQARPMHDLSAFILPAATQNPENLQPQRRSWLNRRRSKSTRDISFSIADRHPVAVKIAIQNLLKDQEFLATCGHSYAKPDQKKFAQYCSTRDRFRKNGDEFTAAAYDLLGQMVRTKMQLEETIRHQTTPVLRKLQHEVMQF